jgi:hypothetical protein
LRLIHEDFGEIPEQGRRSKLVPRSIAGDRKFTMALSRLAATQKRRA